MVIGEHVSLMFYLFHSKVIINIHVANLKMKHLQENIMLINNKKRKEKNIRFGCRHCVRGEGRNRGKRGSMHLNV